MTGLVITAHGGRAADFDRAVAAVPEQVVADLERAVAAVPEQAADLDRAVTAVPQREGAEFDAARMVRRAAQGDQRAWERLVEQYARLIWAITRDFKLSESDAADVSQATWRRMCAVPRPAVGFRLMSVRLHGQGYSSSSRTLNEARNLPHWYFRLAQKHDDANVSCPLLLSAECGPFRVAEPGGAQRYAH
jgi:hypothetical protein